MPEYIYVPVYLFILKGQCHEIFDPYFFHLNYSIWVPDRHSKTVQFFFDFTEIFISKVDSAYTYYTQSKKKSYKNSNLKTLFKH